MSKSTTLLRTSEDLDAIVQNDEDVCNKVNTDFRFWHIISNRESPIVDHDCGNDYDLELDATQ